MDTQLKKGVLDLCVLALLTKKDKYGYEIVLELATIIKIAEGTIYPLLRRLYKEGYVTTYLKESQEGPPRKYYTLTTTGKKQEKKLRKEWFEFEEKIKSVLE